MLLQCRRMLSNSSVPLQNHHPFAPHHQEGHVGQASGQATWAASGSSTICEDVHPRQQVTKRCTSSPSNITGAESGSGLAFHETLQVGLRKYTAYLDKTLLSLRDASRLAVFSVLLQCCRSCYCQILGRRWIPHAEDVPQVGVPEQLGQP